MGNSPGGFARSTPTVAPRGAARLAALALAAILAVTAHPAEAKRIFIPKDHRSLQAGIDAATAGDTIWVSAGTYHGPLTMKKRLVLFGDSGSENTILDGGDSVRVLDIEGVSGGAVVGFTIRRGKSPAGGGIHCVRDTSLLFAGCTIEKNWESAISVWQSSDINLNELTFKENQGSAVSLNFTLALIRNCEFLKNHGVAGGAISLVQSSSNLPIRNCSFVGNSADAATGGAINADSSEVVIADCDFNSNSAKVAGGAVSAMNGSRLAISHCHFIENSAKASGAINVDTSGLNLLLSIFDHNTALGFGSAIGLIGRALANINPLVQSNTFYKNAATTEGTTIWCERVSPEIKKNIFVVEAGQRAVSGLGSTPLYQCNLVHDPSGGAIGALPSADTLVGDPLFCDPASRNFFLRDLSPAALASCGVIGAFPKRCSSFMLAPAK
ncbi:MAG TPA: right-handed parallel beta-helix repeat-containing protein [Candidatus Eisenbacteria bacterium]